MWPGRSGPVVHEERSQVSGNRLWFVVQLGPREVGDRVAGSGQSPIPLAVVAEGRAGVVALPAVELDDAVGAGPVAVDLVALAPEHDPVVEAGQWEAVAAEKGREPFLELRA